MELQSRLDLLASEVSSRTGLMVNGMVTKGKAQQKIVEVADLVSAKLIVMGTSGPPLGFTKKIIGSKAIRVVSKSPCPVITIKRKEHFNGCRTIILPLDLKRKPSKKLSMHLL